MKEEFKVKKEDKISIIVPVYNVEKYVDKCLESLLNQTYKNIEIIIINDGSTDNSGEICKKYADNDIRIRYYCTQNQGVSNARNMGIDYSEGEYILFVDSDDYVDKRMAEVLYKKMVNYNVDLSICNYYFEKMVK